MNIASVNSAYARQNVQNKEDSTTGIRRRGEQISQKTSFKDNDSVEISRAGLDRLSEIKRRMMSGFYDNESVREKISDKLTNVLDDMV